MIKAKKQSIEFALHFFFISFVVRIHKLQILFIMKKLLTLLSLACMIMLASCTEDIPGMRAMMRHSTRRRALFDKK